MNEQKTIELAELNRWWKLQDLIGGAWFDLDKDYHTHSEAVEALNEFRRMFKGDEFRLIRREITETVEEV